MRMGVSVILDELEKYSGLNDEDIFIGRCMYIKSLQPNKAVRSRIEILHELIELKEITGEFYDTSIFD